MTHRNGAYAQLVHHRKQQPEEAPAAADDDILTPEPEEDTLAGKAAARRSMAVRSSMIAGRKSMAPGRKSMAPGRKDASPGRKSMVPSRQSVPPAGRLSVFPGDVSSQAPCMACRQQTFADKHTCLPLCSCFRHGNDQYKHTSTPAKPWQPLGPMLTRDSNVLHPYDNVCRGLVARCNRGT